MHKFRNAKLSIAKMHTKTDGMIFVNPSEYFSMTANPTSNALAENNNTHASLADGARIKNSMAFAIKSCMFVQIKEIRIFDINCIGQDLKKYRHYLGRLKFSDKERINRFYLWKNLNSELRVWA